MITEYQKQMNAIMRFIAADNDEESERARASLREMLEEQEGPEKSTCGVEEAVEHVLLDLGVPCHVKGYNYLITAISLVVDNAEMINAITKELYPEVAKKHHTTTPRAERAIRHAIECGWDRTDLDVAFRYFGNTVNTTKGKPTNSEFISRVANVVRKGRV